MRRASVVRDPFSIFHSTASHRCILDTREVVPGEVIGNPISSPAVQPVTPPTAKLLIVTPSAYPPITSMYPPTSSPYIPSTYPSASASTSSPSPSPSPSRTSNTGAIVGGVVGGIALIG